MAKKILTVFGATGQQGGAVVSHVLDTPSLSTLYTIRAITRNPSSPAALALRAHAKSKFLEIEIVAADLDDAESLKGALKGAWGVFVATFSVYDAELYEREWRQGKGVVDAAVEAGAQYCIFSTLTHVAKVTDGKLKNTAHFDVKADLEAYIRKLPIKSAFFHPGFFMQNFSVFLGPQPVGDGTYAITHFVSPDTKLPLIDIVADGGKYVGTVLADPDQYEGKVFSAATGLYSHNEIVEIMSKASGKTVKYNQIPEGAWKGFLPPGMAEYMVDMFKWIQDWGYYGPETVREVEWTVGQVDGLTTLEGYLERCPLKLE